VSEVRQAGASLVLVGDMQQLQAIEAGAPFRAIVERTQFMELTEVRRQRIPWQQEATKAFAKGHVSEAVHRYDTANHLHEYRTQALAKQGLVELWNDLRLANPLQTQIMLAYTKVDVQELNERARDLRRAQGELGEDTLFQTTRGERAFALNDRIYFLKNDRDLGVPFRVSGASKNIRALWHPMFCAFGGR
jgi:ATP-dependent exoDNAse (exonuclease V) alpha subunit